MVPLSRYEETLQWYPNLFNLKPTDAVFNTETGKDETCFVHIDLGAKYSDHYVRVPPPCHSCANKNAADLRNSRVFSLPDLLTMNGHTFTIPVLKSIISTPKY